MAQAAIKRHLKSIVIRAGLESFHLAERAGINEQARGRGLILTLHQVKPHVATNFAPDAGLVVTPEFLDAAIVTLKASGYTPVALEELPARVAEDPDSEERFVAFTADDGYRNNRVHALPVLQRHSVPLTIFITEGFVKRTHSMWWETAERLIAASSGFAFDFGKGEEQVRTDTHGAKMRAFERLAVSIRSRQQDHFIAALDAASRAAGIDPLAIVAEETMDAAELKEFEADALISFGAHTVSHPSLAHVDEARLADELSRSADYVEGLTGKRPTTLAYPYGDGRAATPREYKAAENAGFALAVTTNAGVLTREAIAATPTALPRVSLNGHFQKPRYVRALASGLAFHFT